MRSARVQRTWIGALLVALTLPSGAAAETRAEIAVIVNPQNPVSRLTLAKLRALFLKQTRRWKDGRPVLAINHRARTPLRASFDRAVLGMSPDAAADYWIKQRVRGYGHPPRSFGSSRIILRLVARQREAVAYVPAQLTRAARGKVKVLAIDGRLPGQKGYPLAVEVRP